MKINLANTTKVTQALEDAQTKSRVRRIELDDVVREVTAAEAFLESFLYKKDWPGITITISILDKFPSSYNGTPYSTYVDIKRYPSGWFVSDICRAPTTEKSVSGIYHMLHVPAEKGPLIVSRINNTWA